MLEHTPGRASGAIPSSRQPREQIDYRAYMASDAWKAKRRDAFSRSSWANRHHHPVCEMCGRYGTMHKNRRSRDNPFQVEGTSGLQVHHVHYRNLTNEDPNDLIVLCTDACYLDAWPKQGPFPPRMGCHERAHDDRDFRAKVNEKAASR